MAEAHISIKKKLRMVASCILVHRGITIAHLAMVLRQDGCTKSLTLTGPILFGGVSSGRILFTCARFTAVGIHCALQHSVTILFTLTLTAYAILFTMQQSAIFSAGLKQVL